MKKEAVSLLLFPTEKPYSFTAWLTGKNPLSEVKEEESADGKRYVFGVERLY